MAPARRRDFIAAFGAAAAWPRVARAQQRSPVVGFIHSGNASPGVNAGLRRGLADTGFVEGQSVTIENAFAAGRADRLPELAQQLARRRVDVIVCAGGILSAQAARDATRTIPVVFMSGDVDPVRAGLVASLSHPGGNLTGITLLGGALGPKRLEILRELKPDAKIVAVLVNPDNRNAGPDAGEVKLEIEKAGQQSLVVHAGGVGDFEKAFATIAQHRADALIVTADNIFTVARAELTAFAARYRIPAIYQWREFVQVGGLMSYGTDLSEAMREVGLYAGRILKGDKPADLPVLQPTKFNLALNLKTARDLDLNVPPTLLARADEVIE